MNYVSKIFLIFSVCLVSGSVNTGFSYEEYVRNTEKYQLARVEIYEALQQYQKLHYVDKKEQFWADCGLSYVIINGIYIYYTQGVLAKKSLTFKKAMKQSIDECGVEDDTRLYDIGWDLVKMAKKYLLSAEQVAMLWADLLSKPEFNI